MATQETAVDQVWTIDPTHTLVEFSAKHMMITTVKGRFGEVEGEIRPDGSGGWVAEATIDVASIDTRAPQRDDHLRSSDFFDVAEHPKMTFVSTGLIGGFENPGDRFQVKGDLTIRGTTREVVLDVTYNGTGSDPWGGQRMSFDAEGKIDRRDFGLTWNQTLEAGGVLVSNDIRISIAAQLVKQG